MDRYRTSTAVLFAACCTFLMSAPASAYIMVNRTAVDFTNSSVSLGFGRGFGTQDITFENNASSGFFDPVSVSSTRGGAFGYSAFFGEPFIFFDPIRGGGELSFPRDSGFTSSSSPVVIRGSIAPPFIIALADTTADGIHYGFARFSSTTLVSYGFETVAGAPITINNATLAAVPLPAAAPLFGAGLLALGAVGYGLGRKSAAAA